MRAAVLYAPGDLRVEERARPTCSQEDDVLIEVSRNGLCGTDATEYAKGPMMVPLTTPHPGSGHVGPTVLGHEFIGQVIETGAAATPLLGARVACGAGISCGQCSWCRDGRTNLCASYYTLGLSTHGGLAEYVAAPSASCRVIAKSCADDDAALAQPLAVGLHAVSRAAVRPGQHVLLLGVGAIGSFICAALKDRGARVTAVDIAESRLSTATALGASDTQLLTSDMSPPDLLDLIGDAGDVVFETSGVNGAAARAAALTRRGGTLALVGLNGQPQPLVLADLVLREVDVRTTVAHVCADDLPAALELLTDWPLSSMLLDRVVPLADVVAQGLDPLVAGTVHGKVLVDPRRSA
jgi:(R,R)-butanediol dehydrogenase / meso-butanediol dehydrogenase / diacetyl reductase